MSKLAITLVTLESHNHIIGDIARGVKIYERGGVGFIEREPGEYWAQVPHKGDTKAVMLAFTRDGQDLEHYSCHCSWRSGGNPVCRHIVAAVLAIQGGVIDSPLKLGKTGTATATVTNQNTAIAVGSGSLAVFATPMLIALMERAACDCLASCLEDGQTSVGTAISVEHTAATPVGMEVTATATITAVFGRKIEFALTASDGAGEIGKGTHTRAVGHGKVYGKSGGEEMKLIGYTNWHDPRYAEIEDRAEEDVAWNLTVARMKRQGLQFPGDYHQNGPLGAHVFDNGKKLCISLRAWGSLMAEVLELPASKELGRNMSYCEWAWFVPDEEIVSPSEDDAVRLEGNSK
jgi:predicted thioesterase